MTLQLAVSLAFAAVSAAGTFWWLQTHTHPELVQRNELEILRSLIQSQHEAVLRELEQLRALLDRNSRR